ncbi:MAG: C1 family peptidase, partial [Ferruginibacter sp.]
MSSVTRLALFISFTGLCCFLFTVSNAQNEKRFFTGDNTDENEFNKISKSARRATRDLENLPVSVSLKQYAPIPGHQGEHGTCVAWSTAYAARTISYCIQHRLTDPDKIKSSTFSPDYLYYYLKKPDDSNCQLGAKIEPALKILGAKGDILLSEGVSGCLKAMDAAKDREAGDYTIKAYTSLTTLFGAISKNEIIAIKKSLAEKKPVIFSIKCYKSLFNVGKDGIWNMGVNDSITGNHAICIVGYDDNKLGGAFEILNSWGTDWGNGGFFWLTYDQLKQYGSYALELMDREPYDSASTRSMGPPQLKGAFSFVLANDFGNEIVLMPVIRTKIDASSSTVQE